MKIYNVFHPNLLQKTFTNLLTGQVNKSVLLVIMNNKEKRKMKNIFNAKNYWNKI